MERGEWLLKTSQWMMVVGIPICIHQMLDNKTCWGIAVAITALLGIVGGFGFNWGIKMREEARRKTGGKEPVSD